MPCNSLTTQTKYFLVKAACFNTVALQEWRAGFWMENNVYLSVSIVSRLKGIKNKKYYFLTLILLLQLQAAAQLPEYHVKMLSDQQGLNAADVVSLTKDKKGFLWLLSQSFIQRFDGRVATKFEFTETVTHAMADSKDRKWVLGRFGVFLFKNDHEGFTPIGITGAKGNMPVCMFEKGSILFLLLSDGLRQLDETSMQFVQTNKPLFSFSKKIQDLYSIYRHTLFVSTGDSLHAVNITTGKINSLPFRAPYFILGTGEDELLVSNWDSQTWRCNFITGEKKEIVPTDINNSPGAVFVRFFGGVHMKANRFLLSSNTGVVEYNNLSKQFNQPVIYHKGRPVTSNTSIKHFFHDNNGNVYMTHADGICFFNSNTGIIQHIRDYSCNGKNFPDIDTRGFAEDHAGRIWIATVAGIAALDMATGELQTYTPSLSKDGINFPSIRYLLFANNKLWTATGGKGLWLMDTATGRFIRPTFAKDSNGIKTANALNEDFIWKMEALTNGNIFIAGGSHCYLVNSNTFEAKMLDMPVRHGPSRSALQDSEGRIWHGTTRGVYCYDANFKLLFAVSDSLPDKRVAAISEWAPGHFFIGSKGLYEIKLQGNAITLFRKVEAVPANRFIYCLQKDNHGDIWLGTDAGLLRYKPLLNESVIFDAADNIQPQAFNSNGLFLTTTGMIFAGGKAGFNFFQPAEINKNSSDLHPFVVSVSVGNDDSIFFKTGGPYQADYFNRSFVIHISAPEYLRPYELQFRYRLGQNEPWISNGNNGTVRMNNLPSGMYQFQPSVSYDGKKWFDADEIVWLQVLKPWWQQWWFRLIVLTSIAAIATAYFQYKKRQRINAIHQQTIDYFANSGHEHGSTADILWDITRNCISRLGFEDCVIYMLDEDRRMLVQRAAYGAKSPRKFEILNPIEIPLGKGITGYVAEKGLAEIVNDTSRDSRYMVDDEVRFSEMVVPIIHNEKTIGIIDSENRQKNFFTKKHLETLQTIASICAAKLSVTMAVERMQLAIRQVEEVNNKMMETQFINLRLQMNPHFLFNSLNSIQHLIVSQQTDEAYKYLSVFSSFLRSVLQYADKTFITLDDELKMLNMYIRLESLGFDASFRYEVKVDESLDAEDILIPPLMIQPLVENAIWHGLLHKEGAKHFLVSFINEQDDNLVCIVEDNGVGRKESGAIKQSSLNNFAYNGKATTLIKERLLLLKQKTGKEASMITEDIQPSGTRIKLIIPYYNNDEV